MSTEQSSNEPAPKRKKGKGRLVIVLGGGVLLGLGGGGAFALMQSGVIGGGHGDKPEANVPKLVRKGEEDPYAPPAEGGKEGDAGAAHVEGEGGSEYRTSYYNFTEDFTSNLKNSEALLQVSLAASTRRDGRVLMWLRKHELAIRSALLAVLSDTPEEDIYTVDGKDRLQKRLTVAINKVLTDTEGFGGVDAVYFKSFIIQ